MSPRKSRHKPKLARCPQCKSFCVFIEADGSISCLTCSANTEALPVDHTGDPWAEDSNAREK
jgi:hypothetical protein